MSILEVVGRVRRGPLSCFAIAGDTGWADLEATAAAVGVALDRHLDWCALAARTVKAYRRQARAYLRIRPR